MVYGIVISLVLALISLAPQAWAATYTANSCNNTAATPDVQNAINLAKNSGDIVLIPAGTCSWSVTVWMPLDHDITLMGSGSMPSIGAATSGGTTITVDSTNNSQYLAAFEVPTGHHTVANLTFEIVKGTQLDSNGMLYIGPRNNGLGNDTLSDPIVIMHHISVRQHESRAGHWLTVAGWPRALIYRVDVRNDVTWTSGGANSTGPTVQIVARDPSVSWLNPSIYGMADTNGARNVYIETSNFANTASAFDFTAGSRAVARYNTFTDAVIADHGKDSGNHGNRTFEIYNNTFVCGPIPWANMGWYISRGGTGVIADNIAPGAAQCWPGIGPRWGGLVRVLRTPQGYTAATTTGTLTSGSPTITNMGSTAGFLGPNGGRPGQIIWGAFIPPGALVKSVDSATQITLTANATGSGSGQAVSVADCYPGPHPWLDQQGWGWAGSGSEWDQVLEPIYIWNNKATVGGTAGEADTYSAFDPTGLVGCSFDNSSQTSAGYIQQNREYYLGVPKPGYVKFTYPHPLATVTATDAVPPPAAPPAPAVPPVPAAPTGLTVR